MKKYVALAAAILLTISFLILHYSNHTNEGTGNQIAYYDSIIKDTELEQQKSNSELHYAMYTTPIEGVIGSAWDTSEEAAYAVAHEEEEMARVKRVMASAPCPRHRLLSILSSAALRGSDGLGLS